VHLSFFLKELETRRGSSVIGASFNLTSSIVGAGCIGIGGAIANSGGLISLVIIIFFADLSKRSYDLVISLAIEAQGSSYENLGFVTYGSTGQLVVILSKGFYSFGSLVAYMVIVKENFSSAVTHLVYGVIDDENDNLQSWLSNQNFVTILLSTAVMLPLSLLRDLTPLERFSAIKIVAVLLIAVIVIYLFATSGADQMQSETNQFVERWLCIYNGIFER
jgi:amino acid permease